MTLADQARLVEPVEPVETKCARLGDVADINPKWNPLAAKEDPVSFVGMAQMSDVLGCVTDEEQRRVQEVRTGYTAFEQGDLLVAKITPCFENGKIGQANITNKWGAGSTEFHVVRPGDRLDAGYALHFLRRQEFRTSGKLRMTGSGGQQRVPASYVAETRIPLPPLPEQHRIAAILDKADHLRTQRREAIAHLDALTQSIFDSMFGNPNNQALWERAPMSALGQIITGNTPPRANPANFGDEIEWIKSDNINTPNMFITHATEGLSAEGKARGRCVPAGSILMTCIAGSPRVIGNVAVTDREVAFNQQINAFVPNEGPSSYWYQLLSALQPSTQRLSSGGMKGMVSKSALSTLEMPITPLELQQTFARRAAGVERLKEHHRVQLAELDALFASLQHRAFSGQL